MPNWILWFCRFCDYQPQYDEDGNVLPWAPEPVKGKLPRPGSKAIWLCPSCRGAA